MTGGSCSGVRSSTVYPPRPPGWSCFSEHSTSFRTWSAPSWCSSLPDPDPESGRQAQSLAPSPVRKTSSWLQATPRRAFTWGQSPDASSPTTSAVGQPGSSPTCGSSFPTASLTSPTPTSSCRARHGRVDAPVRHTTAKGRSLPDARPPGCAELRAGGQSSREGAGVLQGQVTLRKGRRRWGLPFRANRAASTGSPRSLRCAARRGSVC